ncbi:hypothetical protein H6758_02825 [Candidatus Nomurabacteria bacterium]|nr:hypothetical protein [Candidatus Nomurabacteria bacterium]
MNAEHRYEQLEKRIEAIEQRNARVEADKAWETSLFRKVSIVVITYIIAVLVMMALKIESPLVSAVIPTVGFFLSTLTLPAIKKWWVVRKNGFFS